jgi:hypothetical protein
MSVIEKVLLCDNIAINIETVVTGQSADGFPMTPHFQWNQFTYLLHSPDLREPNTYLWAHLKKINLMGNITHV